MSLYSIKSHTEEFINIDIDDIKGFFYVKYNIKNDDELLAELKRITADIIEMHQLCIDLGMSLYYVLQNIILICPELVDKRFLTRMKKIYNTNVNTINVDNNDNTDNDE